MSRLQITAFGLTSAGLMSALGLLSTHAHARNPDGKPSVAPSIAAQSQDALINGPLFERTKKAIAAANQDDGRGFSSFLSPNAQLRLIRSDATAISPATRIPLTVQTLQAVSKSCIGPWAFDEGATWVQLSWICRVDAASPLMKFITFKYSPELSLTIWFKGDLIETMIAAEPVIVPGTRLPTMNAFCAGVAAGVPYPYKPTGCPTGSTKDKP